MNYRHIYHAGNFADVFKHVTLAMIIDYFKKKETAFCVIDAHAGTGFYNLQSIQAEKTNEWKEGIGRFLDTQDSHDDFRIYYDLIKNDLTQGFYAGSPIISSRLLRLCDRLVANELHPQDYQTLSSNMRSFKNTFTTNLDAYECIRAHSPPKEKRGIVLIDPPFEKKDEFEILIKQMDEWKKRFERGVFILWYPIKQHLNIQGLKKAAQALNMPRTWCFEAYIHPPQQVESFNGSGLLVFNAPYTIPERIKALTPFLEDKMSLMPSSFEWITSQ